MFLDVARIQGSGVKLMVSKKAVFDPNQAHSPPVIGFEMDVRTQSKKRGRIERKRLTFLYHILNSQQILRSSLAP